MPQPTSYYPVLVEDAPHPALRYRLAVPTGCAPVPVRTDEATGPFSFSPLARFVDASTERMDVGIHVALLTRDLNAGDFIEIDAKRAGARIVQRRDWPKTAGCQAEVIVEYERAGRLWKRRSRGVKDGSRVFRVDAETPASSFEAMGDACARTVMSFELLSPEGKTSAEALLRYTRTGSLAVDFEYPGSWRLTESVVQEERLALVVEPLSPMSGRLLVDVYRGPVKPAVTECLQALTMTLTAFGVRVTGAPMLPTMPPQGFSVAHVFTPIGWAGGRFLTIAAQALETNDATAVIALVTPSRADAEGVWALNKRAFEVLQLTFTVG